MMALCRILSKQLISISWTQPQAAKKAQTTRQGGAVVLPMPQTKKNLGSIPDLRTTLYGVYLFSTFTAWIFLLSFPLSSDRKI